MGWYHFLNCNCTSCSFFLTYKCYIVESFDYIYSSFCIRTFTCSVYCFVSLLIGIDWFHTYIWQTGIKKRQLLQLVNTPDRIRSTMDQLTPMINIDITIVSIATDITSIIMLSARLLGFI